MDYILKNYNLIGQQFSDLTVKKIININGRHFFLVQCKCGKEILLKKRVLLSGNTKSCGCLQKRTWNKIIESLVGKTVNYLTILSIDSERDKNNHLFYKCKCKCGKIKSIRRNAIIRNHVKSCGCLHLEVAKRRGEKSNRFDHKISAAHRFLRDVKKRVSIEYNIWRSSIRKRDNYCCVICSSRKEIRIHHLDSYSDFPEKRYEIVNGVVLCSLCHETFHYLFGQFHNTKEQYNIFLFMIIQFGLDFLQNFYKNKIIPNKRIINDFLLYDRKIKKNLPME